MSIPRLAGFMRISSRDFERRDDHPTKGKGDNDDEKNKPYYPEGLDQDNLKSLTAHKRSTPLV
jgi:hypothetical protein